MATITVIKDRINQLNQANFQMLCDALLVREGYKSYVSLGTKDGEEKTTLGTPDTYFQLSDGRYIFAEYTTQKRSLVKKISSDIDKCLDESVTGIPLSQIAEIIYCHNSSNIKPVDDRALKDYCEKKGIKLTLLGIDQLAESIKKHPALVKEHLGIIIDSEQIQEAEDFVAQYDSNSLAAPLETGFLFREKEIEEIDKSFKNVKVVLLVGPAGVGKTRLALEYANTSVVKKDEKVFFIHNRSLPVYEELKMYFDEPGKYFVVIDDANQMSELKHILEYVNKGDKGYDVKILMTVRDYATNKVKADINELANYAEVRINSFEKKEITELMKKHYGIHNSFYLDRIVQISEGNARIAMLAGKIACETNRINSIYDVSGLYADYYGKVLQEIGLGFDKKLLISAGIMAFFGSAHLDYIDPILIILEENGLTKEDFTNSLYTLNEYEIVDVCNDKGVRFSDQCMGNFMLKYVFFDKKLIMISRMIEVCFNKYPERTTYAVYTLINVFPKPEIVEYVKQEVKSVWNKLYAENSPIFFKYLKSFYQINELQTLSVIKEHIDKMNSVEISLEDIDTEDKNNPFRVIDDFVEVLGGFENSENLDAALDLFFIYYLKRPDLYLDFLKVSISNYSVNKFSIKNDYRVQITFVEKIIEYFNNGDNPYISLLFCRVAKNYLQLEFSPYESFRREVTLYHIYVAMSEGLKKYRELIWEQLLVLSGKEQFRFELKEILRTYGKAIHDCSKEVVIFEADYICKLSKNILSESCLSDCLIAQSLQEVFEIVNYQTNDLKEFLNCRKYKLYRTINGPKYKYRIPFEQREAKREEGIRRLIDSANDKQEVFKELLELIAELGNDENRSLYGIAEGINIFLRVIADRKNEYISCIEVLLSSEMITGVRIDYIVNTLFSMLNPAEVYDLVCMACQKHQNEWLFAYYSEIPIDLITENDLVGLYSFLEDDSDRESDLLINRNIDFLDKYLLFDDDVIINASRIIIDKKAYSPYVVTKYFGLLFNEHHIHPNEVIKKYNKDLNLLEKIFIFDLENDPLADCHRKFLSALFDADKDFIEKFIKWFVNNDDNKPPIETRYIIEAFYHLEDFLKVLDLIVDEAINISKIKVISVSRIIKQLIVLDDSNNKCREDVDLWIRHYIDSFYDNKDKIVCLFEALSEISMELSIHYLFVFLQRSKDYEIFEAIHLTPLSLTWSGSAVPMYLTWIECLEKLLPVLSGIDFIKHKERVQSIIDDYRKEIKKEEIRDILNE